MAGLKADWSLIKQKHIHTKHFVESTLKQFLHNILSKYVRSIPQCSNIKKTPSSYSIHSNKIIPFEEKSFVWYCVSGHQAKIHNQQAKCFARHFALVSVNCVTTASNRFRQVLTYWEIKHCFLLGQGTSSLHRVVVPTRWKCEQKNLLFAWARPSIYNIICTLIEHHNKDVINKFWEKPTRVFSLHSIDKSPPFHNTSSRRDEWQCFPSKLGVGRHRFLPQPESTGYSQFARLNVSVAPCTWRNNH